MSSERVKSLIKIGDLSTLYENDQLNIQMIAGLTFPHYSESKITFMPTYKFDVGTDIYDTSEKARIPAWTDRILRKGSNIRQTSYQSAPLMFSDHKPVYATFECRVNIVDEELQNSLSRKLFEKRRAEVGGVVANIRSDESEDEDLIGYDSIEPGLPPASTDRRKWWLENKQPARSRVQPPEKGMLPNPQRPSNPWEKSDEPDWVRVSRPVSGVNSDSYPSHHLNRSDREVDGATSTASQVPRSVAKASTTRKKLPPPYIPPGVSTQSVQTLDFPRPQLTNSYSNRDVSSIPTESTNKNSTTSSSPSSINRKQPPQVAKKPVHLTSTSMPSPPNRTNSMAMLPSRKQTAGEQPEFPPPPRRATHGEGARKSNERAVAESGRGQTPSQSPMPRRNGVENRTKSSMGYGYENGRAQNEEEKPPKMPPRPAQVVDLLGDTEDQGTDLGGWEVLKPA
jgi:hypothetical protein